MDIEIKYFSFNKKDDWEKGFCEGLTVHSDALTIADDNIQKEGYFISFSIDTLESKTIWHRAVLYAEKTIDSTISISYYASDNKSITDSDGNKIDLDELLKDKVIPPNEKNRIFNTLWQETLTNPVDMIFHNAKGRFLWIKIKLVAYEDSLPKLNKIRLYYPEDSFVKYLPYIFSKDTFLKNYVSMFQSIYTDIEQKIEDISEYFDPDVVDENFLQWLATWLKIDDGYIWKTDELRYIIKNAVEIYRKRGTKEGIKKIVEIYTGKEPIVVEYFNIEPYFTDANKEKLLKSLYGSNEFVFTVLVDEEQISSEREYVQLARILERYKPAHTEAKLVVIKSIVYLDIHSYIGINSYLSELPSAMLNEMTYISSAVIKNK